MMRTSYWASAIVIGSLVLGYSCPFVYSDLPEKGNSDSEMLHGLVSANTSFGFHLYEKLIERDSESNIFISPASIAMALAMTYNGARGETQQAMAEALALQGMSLQQLNQANAALMAKLRNLDDNVLLDVANSLWARKGVEFKPDFMKINQDFYQAYIETLDFDAPSAPAVIDAWVKEKTRGKIEQMVQEIPGGIILFLINAVYFKGSWAVKFDEKYTRERDFTLLDGSKKKIPMMMSKSDRFRRYRGDGFQAISLPYGDGKVSMYIFLPNRDSSLGEFHKSLSAKNWESWVSQSQREETMIILPKFTLKYEVVLNNALEELGMGVAFDGREANFEGMCSGGGVWIDEVKHKTFVEVNEEGTEAAAATSVRMKKGGPRPMTVDRPFFCAIRDNETGTVLFMGSVVDPQ